MPKVMLKIIPLIFKRIVGLVLYAPPRTTTGYNFSYVFFTKIYISYPRTKEFLLPTAFMVFNIIYQSLMASSIQIQLIGKFVLGNTITNVYLVVHCLATMLEFIIHMLQILTSNDISQI